MRNTDFILNIYEKKSSLSKLASQLLYGETFTVQKNYTNWIKIKSKYDNYVGYIKKKKFKPKVINTHKINKLSAEIYKKPNKNFKIKKKIISQIKLNIPTYKKKNLPSNLKNIPISKPGSRYLK